MDHNPQKKKKAGRVPGKPSEEAKGNRRGGYKQSLDIPEDEYFDGSKKGKHPLKRSLQFDEEAENFDDVNKNRPSGKTTQRTNQEMEDYYTNPLKRLDERPRKQVKSPPVEQNQHNPKSNREKEESYVGSLTERAIKVVNTPQYLRKIHLIKQGRSNCKFMDFVMDGIKIGMPYNGKKLEQGYLKKETKSLGLMLSKTWQLKFCVIDLAQFVFKYAKNPTEEFTELRLKEIVDVVVEEDPGHRDGDKSIFSLSRTDKSREGFNFQIQTPYRSYRMQASTKVEQLMWLRAFAVLFELRARVLANISQRSLGSIDISQYSEKRNKKKGEVQLKKVIRDTTSRHSIDPQSLRSIDEMNDRIEKLRLERITSPQNAGLPNLSFGSVSLSSTIKSKHHPETTKNQSQKKIEFTTIQNPISPKAVETSTLYFYNQSLNRTETEIGEDGLKKVDIDKLFEEQEAEVIHPVKRQKSIELKKKQKDLKQQLELLEMNKKLMKEQIELKQQVQRLNSMKIVQNPEPTKEVPKRDQETPLPPDEEEEYEYDEEYDEEEIGVVDITPMRSPIKSPIKSPKKTPKQSSPIQKSPFKNSPKQKNSPKHKNSPKQKNSPKLHSQVKLKEVTPILKLQQNHSVQEFKNTYLRSPPKLRQPDQLPNPAKRYIPSKKKLESLKQHQINLSNQNLQTSEKVIDRDNLVKLIEFQKSFMKNDGNKSKSRVKIKLPRHKLEIISQERSKQSNSSTNLHDAYQNQPTANKKYNIGQLAKNLKLTDTRNSLTLKTLRLSKQAMDQIRSSRQWKASEKSITRVEKFEPLDEGDEVIIDDHVKSRNNLQMKTTDLQDLGTKERMDYISANWLKNTQNHQKSGLINAAFEKTPVSERSHSSSIKKDILRGSLNIDEIKKLSQSREFKLPIKKMKTAENTHRYVIKRTIKMPKVDSIENLLEREKEKLFVDRIDRQERMKNNSQLSNKTSSSQSRLEQRKKNLKQNNIYQQPLPEKAFDYPPQGGVDSPKMYTNFKQRHQLDLSNISGISPGMKNVGGSSRGQKSQQVIQNINIDQSTNNVYNFYNYGSSNEITKVQKFQQDDINW